MFLFLQSGAELHSDTCTCVALRHAVAQHHPYSTCRNGWRRSRHIPLATVHRWRSKGLLATPCYLASPPSSATRGVAMRPLSGAVYPSTSSNLSSRHYGCKIAAAVFQDCGRVGDRAAVLRTLIPRGGLGRGSDLRLGCDSPLFKRGECVYTRGFTRGYSLGGSPP